MPRTPLLVAATLSLVAAAAHGRGAPVGKVLGWATAGQTSILAYQPPPDSAGQESEMGPTEGSVQYVELIDGRTGRATERFVLSFSNPLPDEKKLFLSLPNRAAFEKWKVEHAPKCAGSGRTSPDGSLRADVKVKGKGVTGSWGKDGFTFDSEDAGASASFTLSVEQGGQSLVSGDWRGEGGAGSLNGEIKLCWSPDGKRVAWVVHRGSGMMRDEGDTTVIVGPTRAPRIQLVADKSILDAAAARVAAALEGAGFVTTSSKASNEKTARKATVVYAAAGFEAAAASLAKAVPGGATVEKLDWKAPFELVVGIGDSALR